MLFMNPLQVNDLSATVPTVASLADRVILRLRDEMSAKKLSQRDVAGMLEWSQTRVARLLNKRIKITLDDLEALCFAVSIAPSEAVRDRGLEFYAEMTPTELRIFERLRASQRPYYEAILTILNVKPSIQNDVKHAGPKPKVGAQLGKPRRTG